MRAHEFIIMPQSIKPMGLIHKPGTGPNDRFGFKNVGNNRANENFADGKKKGKVGAGVQRFVDLSVPGQFGLGHVSRRRVCKLVRL